MNERNPIDELFRQKLEGKEIRPSDAVWEKISAGTEDRKTKRTGGIYIFRAAAVTVLLGLSTWVYFSNNEAALMEVSPETEINKAKKNPADAPGKKAQQKESGENKGKMEKPVEKTGKSRPVPKKEIVPIMRQAKSTEQIYVSHNPEEREVNEAELHVEEPLLEGETLEVKEETPMPRIKLKYTVPVTEKSFYADNNAEEGNENSLKPKFSERVFAYANDQFENLLNGDPLELPKTERKPQLEINLGKFF